MEGRDEVRRLRVERRRAIYLTIVLSIALAAALLLLALTLASFMPGILEPSTTLMAAALLVSAAVVAVSALVAVTLDKLLKVYTAYLYYRVSGQAAQLKTAAAGEAPRPIEARRRAGGEERREARAAKPALKAVVKAAEGSAGEGRKKCPYCGRELPFGDVHIICPYCGRRLK
ncbi:MAG: hypothetical protein J7L75_01155 [Thermoproteales archaeon]|nr:hypothetical protein [Thermoproteales archaeon]